jgi:hypothetical protein
VESAARSAVETHGIRTWQARSLSISQRSHLIPANGTENHLTTFVLLQLRKIYFVITRTSSVHSIVLIIFYNHDFNNTSIVVIIDDTHLFSSLHRHCNIHPIRTSLPSPTTSKSYNCNGNISNAQLLQAVGADGRYSHAKLL